MQGGICLDGKLKLLVVGTIPTKSKKNFEAIVKGVDKYYYYQSH